ncbi:MAG TPA: radical SAM protein [Geobacteraceae bacterium]
MRPLIVPFFISLLGCPHQCIFCDQRKIAGRGELPSAGELLDRIAAFRASGRGRPVEVAFYGGTFTALPEALMTRLLLPLQPLLAAGEIHSIRLSTRPDAVDPSIARFLAGMGVKTVELGAQSMDDDVLAFAGRGHGASHTIEANRILKEAGVAVGMQLMPGLPGDSEEKALESLGRVLELRPAFLRIYPALVIAGTRLAELHEAVEYTPLSLDGAIRLCKIMLHGALAARVRVIRIGLQATAELEQAGTVLAGPYHPAFRQLVEAELFYDLLRKMAEGMPRVGRVSVRCSPERVSDVTGQRRGNLRRLHREAGVTVDRVLADRSVSSLEIAVEYGGEMRKGNIVHDLDYATKEVPLGR